MKILVFTSLFPNAKRPDFGIFIFQRILHLARRAGNVVEVVAPVPYFPSWIPSSRWGKYAAVPREERIEGLRVSHPRYPLLPGLFMPLHGVLMFLGSLFAVLRLYRRVDFDCIDAHYVYPDGFAAAIFGKLLGLPVFVSARGTDINVFPSFVHIRRMIVWTLREGAGVIAVSNALKSAMVNLSVSPEKICVIPNGVDTSRFHPIPRSEARRALGLPEEGKMAVCVASLTEAKNHALLIASFAKTLTNFPNAKLFLIGEGLLRSPLEEQVSKLQLRENVTLVGPRPNEELALWFSAANVSCLASSREGWPNVLMESLSCGTPVVATRVGGVPEIICSPEFGAVAEQDSESFATALQSVLTRDWDQNALARLAQLRGWDRVAEEVEHYFESRIGNQIKA
jgi:teichuronic acid biosynthesis glycosyltransferase TuaC